MSFLKKLILGVYLFVPLMAAQAQYRFDQWTTDDGLPQNSVFSILQTPDGYIWFTTLDGLVRFDGIKFKVFNRSNSPGLTTNRLIYLLAENDNTIWVGTEDGGLLRFQDGKFRAFTTADGLPSVKVTKIFKDLDGNLLAASQTGLARFDGEKFITENRLDARDYALYFSPSGVRWELLQDGLTSIKNGQITKYKLPFQLDQISDNRTFNYPNYVTLLEDRNNPEVLWLTAAANLYRMENGQFTTFSKEQGMPKSLVRSITQDENGTIWIGTENDGLCRLAENRVVCYTTADGLSSNHLGELFIDREKTLWAATTERGIDRISRQTITPLSKKDGLVDSNIYPLLEDRQGNYWIGAFSALSFYKDGKITNFTRENGLYYEIVQSLFEDQTGRIWIGSVGGIEYFENGKFTDFTEKLGLEIGKYDFRDIYQMPDGALWFATNLGLLKYENGTVTKFTTENGLPSSDIKKLFRSANGDFWIGTLGGLVRFDNNKFEVFTEKDGLPGNHVRTIYEDAENLLWIGTYDSGLALLRDGKFTKITLENGLFSNGVFQILPDERGNFWISSNQGIYRVNRQQLIDFADGKLSTIVSTAFGKSDGMLSTECNGGRQPAGLKTKDGKLWFPTQDGVAIVDPESVAFNPLPPPIVIENTKVDNHPIAAFQNSIEIQPGQENLEITYTGLSFIKPEQIRFRYKLEGLDKDWTDAGERRTAYFPYLPPGNYTFRVAAANSDNVWNEQGASVKIVVRPAFYQTWWFIVLCILAVGAIAFWVYRKRLLEEKRKHAAQEEFSRRLIAAHESERRRVAAELHDSLGQTLAMIKNRAVFAVQNSDDLEKAKEELDQITDQSVFAINEVREISYNLRPYLLDRLGLTKALKSLFNKTAENSRLKIKAEIENIDKLFTSEEEMSIYRIVQESLNNILKHAEANEAKINIAKTEDFVILKIRDDGKGFVSNGSVNSHKKDGFGLLGIAERVKLLGGTHTIESGLGEGTSVIIKLKKSEPSAVAGG
jgi:signal transduction histidine kinase/ligand-binding sensor domain-containing protein